MGQVTLLGGLGVGGIGNNGDLCVEEMNTLKFWFVSGGYMNGVIMNLLRKFKL